MKWVEPEVFLLGETALLPGFSAWLQSQGADGWYERVCDADKTKDTDVEAMTEAAARRCYRSFAPGLNANVTKVREDSKDFFRNILEKGHGSVLEHASSTWAFEHVSRVFTHELVRHRAGMAFSQESLRYVRLGDLKVWCPSDFEERCKHIFERHVHGTEVAVRLVESLLDVDNLPFTEKKKVTSAIRRMAPIGMATGIVATFNMRSLRWCIEMRTSRHAEAEIRLVFDKVARIAVERWPLIFQDFRAEEVDGVNEWVPEFRKV